MGTASGGSSPLHHVRDKHIAYGLVLATLIVWPSIFFSLLRSLSPLSVMLMDWTLLNRKTLSLKSFDKHWLLSRLIAVLCLVQQHSVSVFDSNAFIHAGLFNFWTISCRGIPLMKMTNKKMSGTFTPHPSHALSNLLYERNLTFYPFVWAQLTFQNCCLTFC